MFKNAPTPQEFKEGDDAVIVCDVVSSLPPTIIWKHKGRDVILKKDGKALILIHSGVKCPSPSHTKGWCSQGAGGSVCAWHEGVGCEFSYPRCCGLPVAGQSCSH